MSGVLGWDKLQRQLKALEDLETKAAEMAMASIILEDSQVLVPVDKGDLKNSGHIEDTNGVRVVYDSDHALFVEMGTYKMEAQPYLRPAIDNGEGRIVKAAGGAIQVEINKAVR
jgi:HK97 gp10 family phage protein